LPFYLGRVVENIGNKNACIAMPELPDRESAFLDSVLFFFNLMCSKNRSSPMNRAHILGMLYSTKSRPLGSHYEAVSQMITLLESVW